MAQNPSTEFTRTCRNCGFEAHAGRGAWAVVEHPSLGAITQCPECGSTRIHVRTVA